MNLSPSYADRLPWQLSGGEKQRVAIARAFASQPDLLIFDEAVSALDVSVQASILNLLNELQRRNESAYLFISHDLAVVGYLADEVAVMYLGQLVEVGPTRAMFEPPHHPYTEALLSAIPAFDRQPDRDRIRLTGEIPSAIDRFGSGSTSRRSPADRIPSGCRFHPRCPRFLGERCAAIEPPWQEGADGHRIRCHIPLAELLTRSAARVIRNP